MVKQGISISREKAMFVLIVTLGLIAIFLRVAYMLPLAGSLIWFAGVFVCFYVPGNLLLKQLKWKESEYVAVIAHSIALGVALIPLLYMISRAISLPWLMYPFFAALLVIWLVKLVTDRKDTLFSALPLEELWVILALGVSVFLLLHLTYFTDIVYRNGAMLMRHTNLNETIFHLGIINVLKDVFPPYFPYKSGIGFGHYHLNMHLEIEMFSRFFRIDTIKLSFFYFPLLYFSLMVYLPYLFVRKYLGSRLTGVITGLLIFGSDLSFIPGLIGKLPPEWPWNNLFNATIWPLLTLNGFSPAVVIMFLCILHLKEYNREGTMGNLLLFAILGFAGYGFKSSLGPHIMLAACLTGGIQILQGEVSKGKSVIVFSLGALLAMMADMVVLRGGTGTNIITVSMFDRFRDSLDTLGFVNVSTLHLLLVLPLCLVAVFSVRIFSIPDVIRGFRRTSFDAMAVFLFFFVATGYILSELFFLGPIVPANLKTNNAMWFVFEALTACWLLLSYTLSKIEKDRDAFWRIVGFVLLLSLPGTIQFLSLRNTKDYDVVSPQALEVVSFLETLPPDSVVLHLPNIWTPSLATNLAGRQAVMSIYQSYVVHYADMTESQERMDNIGLFFGDRVQIDRAAILGKYHVTHVYAPLSFAQRFDREEMLQPVLKNAEYVVYRVIKSYNKK